jgi:hypothetical protein
MIPAYFIHKRFPKEPIGATGILGNIKINAGGAFAAYIITALLGYFIIENIVDMINIQLKHNLTSKSTWTVEADLEFQDTLGRKIESIPEETFDKFQIRTNPPFYVNNIHQAKANLFDYSPQTLISFELTGFSTTTRFLAEEQGSVFEIDSTNQVINLGKITMKQQRAGEMCSGCGISDTMNFLAQSPDDDSISPPPNFSR